jgi:hypothetical protein
MVGDVERVLGALNSGGVRYLVVGGIAVVLHGYLRTTADLDLVVQLAPDNVRRALQVMERLGYEPRAPVPLHGFADAATRGSWVREKNLVVFSLWSPDRPGLEVDLFAEEPFDFDAVYERSLEVPLDRERARVIALEDLLAMKRAVDRPRDREDVEALEALRDDREDRAR